MRRPLEPGLCAAITWLNDPKNRNEATRHIVDLYDVTDPVADTIRRSIMDPCSGWPPSAFIDPVGIEIVCDLRTENGQPPAAAPSTYYTLEPYQRVFTFGLPGS